VLEPLDAYELYERSWLEPDHARELLQRCWATNGVYSDDEVPDGVTGPTALAELIVATHEALPGFRIWRTSEPRLLAGRLVVTWAGEGGSPLEKQAGADVLEFAPDGRIARLTDVYTPI
jgi:hypothetical protein